MGRTSGEGGGDVPSDGLVISYLTLRRAVATLGVALPVVLAVGGFILAPCRCLQPSISDYYGTPMRDVLVGLLFAIGLFLFSYRGYDGRDEVAGKLACGFAVGVALFPTTSQTVWVHDLHFAFAAGLFLTLAYFSLVLFTQTQPGGTRTRKKRLRNDVYRGCGVAILACIGAIAIYQRFLTGTSIAKLMPVFWLESLALWAFGVSWTVKGEVILKDD